MLKFKSLLISLTQKSRGFITAVLQIGLLCLLLNAPALAQTTVTYFHNDIAGSPMVATNSAGNVVWKASYRPYGDKVPDEFPTTNTTASNKIGYAGSAFDASTGLSYMGARYYDPVIGRFMGIDPVGFQEDNIHSFNRYAYANNNPYRYIDKNGKYAELVFEAMSLTAGFNSLINNMRSGNYGAAAVDGGGIVADVIGAALPGVPGVAGLGIQASRQASKALPDATIVCRGGLCGSQAFTIGAENIVNGKLEGVSTGLGKTITEASKNIPNGKVGVSTVGEIRAAGGKIVNDHGNHGSLSGVTASKAEDLFRNVVVNPNK